MMRPLSKIVRIPALRWALLAAGALLSGVLFMRRLSPASEHDDADTGVIQQGGVAPGGDHRLGSSETLPNPSRSLAECEKTLLPLEAEVNALNVELRRRLPMPRLFALGEPNPDAEQLFRPMIDRIFTAVLAAEPPPSGRTPLPYTLECHDVVCQLTFIANTTAPQVVGTALGGDVELRRSVTVLSFPKSRSTQDILTKTPVNEAKVYWRLREADAGVARPLLLAPVPTTSASSTQAVDCRHRVDDLVARRAELKRRVANLATAKQSFDEAPPEARNAALAAELRKHLRLEGRDDWVPRDVECRRLACRVESEADASTAPVLEGGWGRRNLQGTVVVMRGAVYFRIRDENVPAGVDVVQRFVDDFRRSRAVDGCTARFHDEGKLQVHLDLGAEDDGSLDEAPPGLSIRTAGGPLADTPLGTCIIDALRDAFGRASLPPVYTNAVGYRVVFPE